MRFFISYKHPEFRAVAATDSGSEPPAFAIAVIAEITRCAQGLGHTVFFDGKIEASADWETEVHVELHACDAAIVLVDGGAATSDWVRREVEVLSSRWHAHRSVSIVAVMLEVPRRRVSMARRLGKLGELQRWQVVDAVHHGRDAALLAAAAMAPFPEADDTAPFVGRWLNRTEAVLGLVASHEHLRNVAEALGVTREVADRLTKYKAPRLLAREFHRRRLGPPTIDAVDLLLSGLPPGKGGELGELFAPTWVDLTAAAALVMDQAASGVTAILNAADQQTAAYYIKRATCSHRNAVVGAVSCRAGEDVIGEILHQCDREVDLMLTAGAPPMVEAELEKLRRAGPPNGLGYLIVMPDPPMAVGEDANPSLEVEVEAVKAIRERYPWLTVVMVIGSAAPTPDDVERWSLADSALLEPLLAPSEEVRGLGDAGRLLRITAGR